MPMFESIGFLILCTGIGGLSMHITSVLVSVVFYFPFFRAAMQDFDESSAFRQQGRAMFYVTVVSHYVNACLLGMGFLALHQAVEGWHLPLLLFGDGMISRGAAFGFMIWLLSSSHSKFLDYATFRIRTLTSIAMLLSSLITHLVGGVVVFQTRKMVVG